ncbi:Xylose operon regulatory protein [Pseudobythopirellula maris]|uniref:Xylose operon regulatory protein n=1 Tax=Pseudobythopirellula maris TaxID=2527991 RepID=A0A5C5ZRP0_9BACT|nr:DNA-binding transcriptional regulator [Pseudobythopirellula maris]TWT90212.1 Xylose operon regulatory protein [Pseudobythopirellula maris]
MSPDKTEPVARSKGPKAKVALLVETSRSFGRELLNGIARYCRENGQWSFHISPGDYEHTVPLMKQWGGNGIIARIPNSKIAKRILEADLPTVAIGLTDEQLQPDSPLHGLSEVSSDAVKVSRLAADHLLDRQFTRFAYVGSSDRGWSSRRETAFVEHLGKKGYEPWVYSPPKSARARAWENEQGTLAKWIARLPTPVGLFSCDDDRGREVLEACALAGLRVPEDIAVIGVDNDEVFCDLSDPPLSSVALDVESAGYHAAALLDGLMSGRIKKSRIIRVEPKGVVTRRSTDIVAVEDEDVAAALQIIHRDLARDVTAEMVIQEVAVSRRNLEKRFREVLGRTILEEIQRVRLGHAKRLLLSTGYPVGRIAKLAGFGSIGYFIQFFQKRVGTTPARFRQNSQGS